MVAKVFVLIEKVGGGSKEVAAALKRIEGMNSVDTVTGPYDIIAVVERATLTDIGNVVIDQILPIAGVCRIMTCLAL